MPQHHDHHADASNGRRFSGGADRLRDERRVALMEIPRTVDLASSELPTGTVLDVGTGSGLFAEAFAARGWHVSGIDLREDMLEAARQHVPTGDFRQGHMEDLPYPDASFDLVFLGHVLHEADDLAQAMIEARRVARRRVAILEWPFREEPFGPPLDHRLAPEVVARAAKAAGIASVVHQPLDHMDLFLLDC